MALAGVCTPDVCTWALTLPRSGHTLCYRQKCSLSTSSSVGCHLHFNSSAVLCNCFLKIFSEYYSASPSAFSLVGHRAAHDRYQHLASGLQIGNNSDPANLQCAPRSLEEADCGCSLPTGFGYPRAHLAVPELKGSVCPGTFAAHIFCLFVFDEH